MRSFFQSLLRCRPFQRVKEPQQQRTNSTTRTMSGGMTAAALYACTMTSPASLGAVPEDTEAKAHHLKDGKGFTNPWDSWREMSAPQFARAMLW
jgi:N-acyl-phosphatidylethanolamine-hydrolysing phospholipase D